MKAMFDIFVFSFNRGRFLDFCIASIEACAPGRRVTIIDDGSTDPDTRAVLQGLQARHEVIEAGGLEEREFKTGGLSGNMNLALDLARGRGTRQVLFIQDDMQFVRRLTDFDAELIERYFDANPDVIQLQTGFIRRLSEESMATRTRRDRSEYALFKCVGLENAKDNFSDTGVFDVGRVGALFGRLGVGEGRNSAIARAKGIQLGRSLFPFMNWLPYPMSHRGKRRSPSHLLIERLGGAGFHPIEFMSAAEAVEFLARDPSILPIAEAFLVSPAAPRHDIWSTGGGEYNLLARGGWRARAFRSLVAAKRQLFGSRSARRSGPAPAPRAPE